MTEHSLAESARCTVDRELTLDDEGNVTDEEITNVSAPADRYSTEYHCSCGEDFEHFKNATDHVLDNQ